MHLGAPSPDARPAGRGDGSRGETIARLLAKSWRSPPPEAPVSPGELDEVAPWLLASGAGALAWWRIRGSPLAECAGAAQLRQAHRAHAIRAAVHDRDVAEAFRRLRGRGVEAVLVKGWAAARLYPRPGLRPYGDIDLLVPPGEMATARAALEGAGLADSPDLHDGGGWLSDRRWGEVLERSRSIELSDTAVRVAGPEDHLRYLCLHFLGHGAWRAIWLCDIGAALESLPDGFDWGYFLGGARRRSEWTAQAVALAERLLGAEGPRPGCLRGAVPPPWFVPSVLREWGREHVPHGTRVPMTTVLRTRKHLLRSFGQRWPNPVEATLSVGAAFDSWPRAPLQLAACAARTARFVLGLSRT